MTVKYLSGFYPGGYALNANYTGLVIEASGAVGGAGVFAGFAATITNLGTVLAGGGDTGVQLAAGGVVVNGSSTDTAALIEGYVGVQAQSGPATITNYGSIVGTYGVLLNAGGTVTNGSAADETASISGMVYAEGAASTVANFGRLSSVRLAAGGAVTNGSASDTSALISAGGVWANGAAAAVVNYGAIHATGGGVGVQLLQGGAVTNGSTTDTAASIAGRYGVIVEGAAGVVENYGTISALTRIGVDLESGGSATCGAAGDTTALIQGYIGVQASSSATVTNFGSIRGTGGTALLFTSASDTLVVEAGSSLLGAVLGGGGGLDLASGVGSISGLSGGNLTVYGAITSTAFTHFGTLEIGAGAQFTLVGGGTIGSGGTYALIDEGVLKTPGALVVTGQLTLGGAISGLGSLTIGPAAQAVVNKGGAVGVATWSLTGGTTTINEKLTFTGAFSQSGPAVLALGTRNTLTLAGAASLAGSISGAGTISLADATLGVLTSLGTTALSDTGTVTQTGTLGIGSGSITVAPGAQWSLAGNFGISPGSTQAQITIDGLFEKTAGAGTGVITPKVANNGGIVVSTGTLQFQSALSGTGTLTLDAGACVEADSTVAAGLTIDFAGDGGRLAVGGTVRQFLATIAGFAPGDVIDLLHTIGASVTLTDGDVLVVANKSGKTMATLQLTGDYTGDTFKIASDGAQGSKITVAFPGSAPPHAFAAAMAAWATPVGQGHASPFALHESARPLLAAVRLCQIA